MDLASGTGTLSCLETGKGPSPAVETKLEASELLL